MDLFCSDIDNTLIYSHKRPIKGDKVCVEVYEGREVSFMERKWMEGLKRISRRCLFVPVTTRSLEQYRRLDLGTGTPRYALVCNGGILLKDGVRDSGWYEDSLALARPSLEGLRLSMGILEQDGYRKLEVRFIENLFVFTKSSRPEETVKRLEEPLLGTGTRVFCNGEKVYVLPEKLDKGTGLSRLIQMVKPRRVFAAGDSGFDKSMLLLADFGMCPEGLFEEMGDSILSFATEEFTDGIIRTMEAHLGSADLQRIFS